MGPHGLLALATLCSFARAHRSEDELTDALEVAGRRSTYKTDVRYCVNEPMTLKCDDNSVIVPYSATYMQISRPGMCTPTEISEECNVKVGDWLQETCKDSRICDIAPRPHLNCNGRILSYMRLVWQCLPGTPTRLHASSDPVKNEETPAGNNQEEPRKEELEDEDLQALARQEEPQTGKRKTEENEDLVVPGRHEELQEEKRKTEENEDTVVPGREEEELQKEKRKTEENEEKVTPAKIEEIPVLIPDEEQEDDNFEKPLPDDETPFMLPEKTADEVEEEERKADALVAEQQKKRPDPNFQIKIDFTNCWRQQRWSVWSPFTINWGRLHNCADSEECFMLDFADGTPRENEQVEPFEADVMTATLKEGYDLFTFWRGKVLLRNKAGTWGICLPKTEGIFFAMEYFKSLQFQYRWKYGLKS